MLNTSLRRVARTCSSSSSPVQSRPTTPTITSFASPAHQRRHSSSKPPIPPNNGSPTIPASVKQVGAPSSDSKQATSESRLSKRRTAKGRSEGKHESEYYNWASTLPSVPSLQHLNPKDLYVAAFFGTHRPISITGPVFPVSSMQAVDKMFQPKPKRSRTAPQDVIYTLSSAVENFDEQITNKKAEQKAHIIKALMQGNSNVDPNEIQHLDGAPQTINPNAGNVRLALQELARNFRPYNVPPPPVPIQDPENKLGEAGEEMQARVFEVEIQEQDSDPYIQQVVINVPKSQDVENVDFFTSNEAPAVEVENPVDIHEVQEPTSNQLPIGRRRRGVYVPNRQRYPDMMALSVKRQRRLKMKKHKFKKLTRRTRNLKMRQGKI